MYHWTKATSRIPRCLWTGSHSRYLHLKPWVAEPISKWGGTNARWKEYIAKFVVWIGNCDVTSIEIWRHYIYTIWRSKLHYLRQNYTAKKTYRWTTWNSNRLLQGRRTSSALLGLIIRFILTDWIKPLDACVTEFPFAFILADIIVAFWRYVIEQKMRNSYDNNSIVE